MLSFRMRSKTGPLSKPRAIPPGFSIPHLPVRSLYTTMGLCPAEQTVIWRVRTSRTARIAVTNMPLRTSRATWKLVRLRVSAHEPLMGPRTRRSVLVEAMTIAPGTPFPETSATTSPSRSASRGKKS